MKFITADEAASLVNDGDLCATSTDGLVSYPNELFDAIERRFIREGHPHDIGMSHCGGLGNWSMDIGEVVLSRNKGLLTTSFSSFVGTNPVMVDQIINNEIKCYMLSIGVLQQLLHEIGRGMPGLLTRVGLGTMMDPRLDGCKCNEYTEKHGVDVVDYIPDFQGQDWLWFRKPPFKVALLAATTADKKGNVSCEDYPMNTALLNFAMGVRACGGIVIVQVQKVVEVGEIHPRMVKVPSTLVDYIVVAEHPEKVPQNMERLTADRYEPALTGGRRVEMKQEAHTLPLDMKKVIARRAAQELVDGQAVNMGIGMPQMIGEILAEQGRGDKFTPISETGSIGGVPGMGRDFGCHWNVEALIDHCDHFSYFDGGNLDVGIFGLSEVDQYGNLNVSHLSGKIIGLGGFTDIVLNSKKSLFIGTFTAAGLKTEVADGKIRILKEGRINKFVKDCTKISYDADEAFKAGHANLYITERCVFEKTAEGMVLREVAPGIDIEKDILAHMDFEPVIPAGGPVLMDEALFRE